MPLNNIPAIRSLLKQFEFKKLFNQLGWDNHSHTLPVIVDSIDYTLNAIAQKRGYSVYVFEAPSGKEIPTNDILVKIERQVTKSIHEHLIIYINGSKTTQLWQFAKREAGKPTYRTYRLEGHQSGESLAQKLSQLAISIDEEEQISLVEVTRRTSSAFYVEKITKKFYEDFKAHHELFLKFLKGIPDEDMQRWYVSIMLNRVMFIYFIQKKNFLNGDSDYLRTKLRDSKKNGKDLFYENFLTVLFFEGFAKKESSRSAASKKLLGIVPYLNGGLFLPHEIEKKYGKKIVIPDSVFDKLFEYFERYNWHLDERPIRDDKEINPDVLGYIFEKYINQKQMGAFYTKEDITGYNSRNTIIPRIFDIAKEKCEIAFEGDHSVWTLLQADPNRYIYEAVKEGVDLQLPKEIEVGIKNVAKRTEWNKPAPTEYALKTEIWREVVARRERYQDVYSKLANGEIRDINDFITYNLDIQQFAQDVIETCEGPELLRAFWFAIENLTVLDPTSGSGAFLFAALNILELLYEACLNRMQDFVDAPLSAKHKQTEQYADFRIVLDRISHHPNKRYFIYKSIIVKNLFGVDIMEEAVEICKLRLFLKLVAQIDDVKQIEPLPDIDFNIRAGNTLVGFARMEDYDKLFDLPLVFESGVSVLAGKVAQMQSDFNKQQLEDGSGSENLKKDINKQLEALTVHFDQELALAYGFFPRKIADKTKADKLTEFKETHKPFHWCIEFFNIMANGGFDVIIGNPPYVEKKTINNYSVVGYTTVSTNNLYAYCSERAFNLMTKEGRFGFIIPLSSMSTEKFKPLQNIILNQEITWLNHYDDRPARLFEGLEHIQLTIVLAKKGSILNPRVFSTNCRKWSSIEREIIFQTISYISSSTNYLPGSFQKIGTEQEISILNKIFIKNNSIESYVSSKGKHKVFYTRKVHAFLNVLDFVPKIYDSQKQLREPSEQKTLDFDSRDFAVAILCALNSSLFRWFLTTFSDCRNVNRREVLSFRIDLKQLIEKNQKDIHLLGSNLSKDLKNNSELRKMRFNGEQMEVQCIIPKHSKPIIDEIDQVLADHYGFDDDELDFIINYDIKYRMGKQEEEEEE